MTELRVVVPDEIAERLASEAAERGTSAEELASEAVRNYLGPVRAATRRPRFVGIGHSGRSDISERAEEILNEHFGR